MRNGDGVICLMHTYGGMDGGGCYHGCWGCFIVRYYYYPFLLSTPPFCFVMNVTKDATGMEGKKKDDATAILA